MGNHHGMRELKGLRSYSRREYEQGQSDRFGRLFTDAQPLFTDPRALERLGAKEGPMNGGRNLPATRHVPVGIVFLGQFIDHDITLDVSSSFDSINEPGEIVNIRSATLDLDCVYGAGPEAMPFLYHAEGDFAGAKLNTGAEVGDGEFAEFDLPRIGPTAVIGDPRNDENRIVSQIQLAFIRAHNMFCDEVAATGEYDLEDSGERRELFESARRLLTWHYQWGVVHGFLETICGAAVVRRVLSEGRVFYRPKAPFIPVEFSVAAYRFGHSMVPMKIQAQAGGNRFDLFGDEFGRGFAPVAGEFAVVDMHEIFDTYAARNVERASRLDTQLASRLLSLPSNIVGTSEMSLAIRNLDRGQSFLLPSGETVAKAIGRESHEIRRITMAARRDEPGLVNGTPLWFYILKEAELIGREVTEGNFEGGEGLGPVGATIVAEVMIGLIELDERSWLANDRSWRPETVTIDGEEISLDSIGDLLAWAQAPLP